jgi:cytochrome c oxidase cbb3-type subunit 1
MKPTKTNYPLKQRMLLTSLLLISFIPKASLAQAQAKVQEVLIQPGIIITLALVLIPMLLIVVLLYNKTSKLVNKKREEVDSNEAERFADYLLKLEAQEVDTILQKRKEVLHYKLSNDELGGRYQADDNRGIINNVNENSEGSFVPVKKKAAKRPNVNPKAFKDDCLVFRNRGFLVNFRNYHW